MERDFESWKEFSGQRFGQMITDDFESRQVP